MDKSDFAFKDGAKRPMVKTLPSGVRGSITSGINISQGSALSRAPIPKFSMVGNGNSESSRQNLPNTQNLFVGAKRSGSNAFTLSNSGMVKVSPKSFNKGNLKYGSKNSTVKAKPAGIVLTNAALFGGSNINSSDENYTNFKKVSTDNQVTSAQPSPRKSLRLQPDDNNNNDRRIPTNDELRLFSVPPVNSTERSRAVPKKFQSRGRDIRSVAATAAGVTATTTAVMPKTNPPSRIVADSYNYSQTVNNNNAGNFNMGDFPDSTKPGDKRTSTVMYKNSTSSKSNDVNIIDGMEVIIPKGETEGIPRDRRSTYDNAVIRGENHRNSDNIVADLTNPDEERPRNSILDVFSKIRSQIMSSNSLSSLESKSGIIKDDNSRNSNITIDISDVQESRRVSVENKGTKLKAIVESIVTIDPEENYKDNILSVPQDLNTHRLSESQVVNASESNNENDSTIGGVIINQGSMGVGRTSVQMVKLGDVQKNTKVSPYEVGNTFKLDEYGLHGHLKWLYGEETEINIALGPNAREINVDAVKTDSSYHVNELDPFTQSTTASKIRKWVNPIHGRIFVVLTTSFALVGIFFQSLIYNRLNKWTNSSNSSSDCGGVYVESFSINSMLGPCSKTLSALGGLVVNELRNGEIVRMFWAMWMHTGFIHIGFNVISQAQLGYMIEPDWGMLRFFLLFFLSGVGGNLAVAVISPCSLTVGSSGGLFGITAASIPYTFENWDNLPAPMFMFIFSLFSLIIGMILSFTGVTNPWAHIGGFIVGILYTFATMKACKGCSPEDRLDRYNRMAALPLFRLFMKQDKDWIKKQLEEKKRKKMDKRNSKIAQQWRKNQRVKKNALIRDMKIEKPDCDYNNDGIGLVVDDHGIKRRTDLMILIDRIPVEKVKIVTKLKIFLRERIKSLREKKLLWTFRILSALLLIIYFIVGWLGSLYPPLYWPNPIGVISFSAGATQCGCCYVDNVYTCGSNPAFIEWCGKKGEAAQPQRSILGFDF